MKYQNQAKKNKGKWFFTEYNSQAKKKIFFVEYESQADLKIHFVDYKSQSGWKNPSKKHLMYKNQTLQKRRKIKSNSLSKVLI